MVTFSSYIDPARKPVKKPEHYIDKGRVSFGTYKEEIEGTDFSKLFFPTRTGPLFKEKKRTTLNSIFLLSKETLFYGGNIREEKETYPFLYLYSRLGKGIASLLPPEGETPLKYAKSNGSFSFSSLIEGYDFQFDGECENGPLVNSLPLGKNRPLLSSKSVYGARGYLNVMGHEYRLGQTAKALLLEREAFYPHDYVERILVSFLDDGILFISSPKSLEQDKYSENVFLSSESSLLTVSSFSKRGFIEGYSSTGITLSHGMGELLFKAKWMAPSYTLGAFTHKKERKTSFGSLSGIFYKENGEQVLVKDAISVLISIN